MAEEYAPQMDDPFGGGGEGIDDTGTDNPGLEGGVDTAPAGGVD
jgi:hypothetical protein